MATPERAEERISMSDLLASCAAASAVSTPPRETEPAEAEPGVEHETPVRREAA
ncbi:hypothetical protein [Streptomyces sp. QHH-9511]|uniref:hypothetical protein n=1 Tax=Streptomyces sp. QHH-9511 TaxID=2684468 RepID=UPI0018E074DA|nr:hypothetical protein [Streptomyces sp. QHH-9511]